MNDSDRRVQVFLRVRVVLGSRSKDESQDLAGGRVGRERLVRVHGQKVEEDR